MTEILNLCQHVIANVESKIGEPAEIYPIIDKFTLDVIGKAGFGVDFETQTTNNEQQYTLSFIILFYRHYSVLTGLIP